MEQNLSKKTRTESDLIGSREVPESALYGVQTLRGIENFRISKFHLNEYPLFIQALAITKMGATVANRELDLLTEEACITFRKVSLHTYRIGHTGGMWKAPYKSQLIHAKFGERTLQKQRNFVALQQL